LEKNIAIKSAQEIARDLLTHLKGTQFQDIGEFSRPVHAEMALTCPPIFDPR
jgi:hypothetical protein